MMTRLFFTQPLRRWLVSLALWPRLPRRLDDWITDRLYPDDCIVTFHAAPDEERRR